MVYEANVARVIDKLLLRVDRNEIDYLYSLTAVRACTYTAYIVVRW